LRQTGWAPDDLIGKLVLDVGCGAGRFAEIALFCGAIVIGLDYSSAVDACWQNLGEHRNMHVIQADIYALPFRPESFDFVYCLGVLQHTPDVKRALMTLPKQLAEGGRLVVDSYLRNLSNLLHPKSWLRPITSRMDPENLFLLVERVTPILLPISRAVGRIPFLGRYFRRFVPVANYEGVYPLSDSQLLHWAILDTYDWLSPRYDQPQTPATLKAWLVEANLQDVEVFRAHHLTGRGRKPASATVT
jgi:SAM-dependent methyltransferase